MAPGKAEAQSVKAQSNKAASGGRSKEEGQSNKAVTRPRIKEEGQSNKIGGRLRWVASTRRRSGGKDKVEAQSNKAASGGSSKEEGQINKAVYVSSCMRTAHKRHILAVRTYTKKFGEALLSWFDEDRVCAAEISDT